MLTPQTALQAAVPDKCIRTGNVWLNNTRASSVPLPYQSVVVTWYPVVPSSLGVDGHQVQAVLDVGAEQEVLDLEIKPSLTVSSHFARDRQRPSILMHSSDLTLPNLTKPNQTCLA